MTTSDEIKRKALELAEKTDSNSITPKEVGGIMHDLASLGENAIRNGGTLGVRKVYESVAAMEADTNPVDLWGNPIKKGNLVVIYDGTTTGTDNNKVYAFMNPGWELATYLDAGYATRYEVKRLSDEVEKKADAESTTAKLNELTNEVASKADAEETNEKLSELGSEVDGIKGYNQSYSTNKTNPASFTEIPTIRQGSKVVIELTEDENNGANILYVYGKTESTDSSSLTMAKFPKGSVVGDKIDYVAENDISFIKVTGGTDGNAKSINIAYVGMFDDINARIQSNNEEIGKLNSEVENVKDMIYYLEGQFDSSYLKVGMYAITADSGVKPTFGNTSATQLKFLCGKFECKEGWTVRLKTKGGTGTARAYCFTDSYGYVISRYDAVADCDVEIKAPEGTSYLYVNCEVASSDIFSLELSTDVKISIKELNNQVEELSQYNQVFPQIHTQPIRRRSKDEPIRVFLFGSSWHMNTWWYLNKLIKEAGINAYIEAWFSDGAYFSQWLSRYRGEAEQSNLRRYVSTNGSNWSVTLTENIGATDFRDSLQQANWDIIGFQQGAVSSIDWGNYKDYWSDIVSMVRSNASNDTVIAYNATWAPPIYSSHLTEQTLEGQREWMDKANGCFTKFLALSGIVEVIPQGSMMWAIRRNSTLNDADDLCKDNLHLKNGLPIYATGANWFESIIQPMYGTSINEITWLPTEDTQACPTSTGYFTPISIEQSALIKKIIRLAASNRWGFPSL